MGVSRIHRGTAQILEKFAATALISRQRLRDDSYEALFGCISAPKQERLHLTTARLRSSSDFHTTTELMAEIRTLRGWLYGINANPEWLHPDNDNLEPCLLTRLTLYLCLAPFSVNTLLLSSALWFKRLYMQGRSFWRTSTVSLWLFSDHRGLVCYI